MGWLLGAMASRVRALILADVAGSLEVQFHARAAARRAWLYAEADRHEAAGRKDVAAELRRRAGGLTTDRPLAGVLVAVADLASDRDGIPGGRAESASGPGALPPKGTTARAGRIR